MSSISIVYRNVVCLQEPERLTEGNTTDENAPCQTLFIYVLNKYEDKWNNLASLRDLLQSI